MEIQRITLLAFRTNPNSTALSLVAQKSPLFIIWWKLGYALEYLANTKALVT